jgi:hypothetical protein
LTPTGLLMEGDFTQTRLAMSLLAMQKQSGGSVLT